MTGHKANDMKKPLIAIAIAVVTLSLSSCKKEYTCKCQKIYTGSSGSATINDGQYTFKDTKVRAEDRCNQQEGSGSDLGGDYSRECQIQ
jgi:hypothetical protein